MSTVLTEFRDFFYRCRSFSFTFELWLFSIRTDKRGLEVFKVVIIMYFHWLLAKSAYGFKLLALYQLRWWHVIVDGGFLRLKIKIKVEGSSDGMKDNVSVTKTYGLIWKKMGSVESPWLRYAKQKWISLRLSTQIFCGNWSGTQLRSGPTTTSGHSSVDDDQCLHRVKKKRAFFSFSFFISVDILFY